MLLSQLAIRCPVLFPLVGSLLVQAPAAQLFGPEEVVSTSADGPTSVSAADLDGDGDLDALSASVGLHKIAWYENTDGVGARAAARPARVTSAFRSRLRSDCRLGLCWRGKPRVFVVAAAKALAF